MVLGFLFPAFCCADWISRFPTALTLQPNEFRIDYSIRNDSFQDEWKINFGLLPFLEARLTQHNSTNVDLQYSITQPFPEVAPGLAVGIRDLTHTPEFYFAATFQYNIVSTWAKKERATFTFGTGTGKLRKSAFVSASVPIFPKVTLLTEWFGKSQMFGIDFEPIKGIGLRASIQDQLPLFSIQYRRLF